MVVILILTGMVPVSRPISPTGDPLPVTKLQPDLPVGPFRVQVTQVPMPVPAWANRFEPRASDDLGLLVSAQGPEKAWLRARSAAAADQSCRSSGSGGGPHPRPLSRWRRRGECAGRSRRGRPR
jgi:hypothetical protein